MTTGNPTAETLAALGISAAEGLAPRFAEVRQRFDRQAAEVGDEAAWESLRQAWLGRKSGVITQITDNWLKPAAPELKRAVGQSLNELRGHVETTVASLRARVDVSAEERALAAERVDLSLELPRGAPGQLLLRTHTSPMQARTMEKQQPPVRIIVPGKVYRRDNPDATHSYVFHQLECLAVDTDITFCDFKGTVEYFVTQFLGPNVKTRMRPSYFPFTEPSAEVDATCLFCDGKGCTKCKQSGWIELFGAGMVDPAVYGFAKYDAKKLSGFAFGLGVDRMAMLKYGTDIQTLFQNDVRFLRQFQ